MSGLLLRREVRARGAALFCDIGAPPCPGQAFIGRVGRRLAPALAAAALAGCSVPEALGLYDLPESPGVAAAPYPSLAAGPRPAEARAAAPDPAVGAATAAELRAEAEAAAARAEALAGPVVDVEALREEAAAVRRGR